MKRDEILKLVQKQRTKLAKQFGVIRLALFGSIALDAASLKAWAS